MNALSDDIDAILRTLMIDSMQRATIPVALHFGCFAAEYRRADPITSTSTIGQ